MRLAYHQRGITFWGWLYILATLGFILLFSIKSFPVYMNYYDIKSTLEWAAKQPELANASQREIRNRIQRRFDSGYVRNINARDVKLEREKDGRYLSVEYEVREPLFYNIDLVYSFKERVQLMKWAP